MEFPYHRRWIASAETLFQNLQKWEVQPCRAPFRLKSYYGKLIQIPLFQNRYLSFKNTEIGYWNIDVLSDWFQEDHRIRAYKDGSISAWDHWQNSLTRARGLQNELLSLKEQRDQLEKEIYIPRQFRPTHVKSLIQTFYPEPKGKRMLDISAGWGDRLLTAMALDMEYLGFDPNTQLQKGYQEMIDKFGDSRHRVECQPFETAKLPEKYFDLVLSSPPFFDLEHYTSEATQSIVQYPELETWLTKFLFPSLDLASQAIKPGGYLILHLGDTYRFRICDRVLNHLHHLQYQGVIGLIGSSGKVSPVWVWKI